MFSSLQAECMRPRDSVRNRPYLAPFYAVNIARFLVFAASVLGTQIYWRMMACIFVNRHRRFGRDWCRFQVVISSEMSVTFCQLALLHVAEDLYCQAVRISYVQQSCLYTLTWNDFRTSSYQDW
jgi:hypothetical protein